MRTSLPTAGFFYAPIGRVRAIKLTAVALHSVLQIVTIVLCDQNLRSSNYQTTEWSKYSGEKAPPRRWP